MNHFGRAFIITTFGESHGKGIGCVIDGVPSGLKINEKDIQHELNRRKPGKNIYSTPRKESDEVEILSGVFNGVSTGTPMALFVKNKNQKSKDYTDIATIFRPGHGDFTYFKKYDIRDYRGGGRSSARETVARVAAGAVAKKLLSHFGIEVQSGVCGVGGDISNELDFEYAKNSEIFALDRKKEEIWKEIIQQSRKSHDSVGGVAFVRAIGLFAGLGEPLYYKLDGQIGSALMGLNGVKAVEIGEGVNASSLKGSQNNDNMNEDGFLTNHSGGVLAGISSGADLDIKVHFKPTPSIFLPQQTKNEKGESVKVQLRGRHDPCIALRGSVVAEMMTNILLADLLLLNSNKTLKNLEKIYKRE